MPELTIDGKLIYVEEGQTILDAARKLGIFIPTICHLQGYEHNTACMACVVKVEGQKRFIPSCAAPAREGMIVRTTGDDLADARRTAVELLLADHTGDCVAPCETACPLNFNAPEFLRLLQKAKNADAAKLAREELVFPRTLGYTCPAYCMKACRRSQHDNPVAIATLHRELEHPQNMTIATNKNKRVGIIGAGAAGLAAADLLRRNGYNCTIYEKERQAGGQLLQLVQNGYLPEQVLTDEIRSILTTDIKFIANHEIKQDKISKTCAEYDAVLNATGINISPGSKDPKNLTSLQQASTRNVTRDIAAGLTAAKSVMCFLGNLSYANSNKAISVHMGKVTPEEMSAFLKEVNKSDSHQLINTADFADEAARCLHCDCRSKDNCRLRKTAEYMEASPAAYRMQRREFSQDTSHPDILYESGKCIVCGLCIQAAREHGEKLGNTFIGRGFTVKVAPPFNALIDKALLSAGTKCVQVCPTGALSMRNK